jgi:hypothetical protein
MLLWGVDCTGKSNSTNSGSLNQRKKQSSRNATCQAILVEQDPIEVQNTAQANASQYRCRECGTGKIRSITEKSEDFDIKHRFIIESLFCMSFPALC